MTPNVWVVIPAYNEGENITEVLEKTKQHPYNLLVVNDGSRDNTEEVIKKHNVKVLSHIINMGKGATLKTGCDYAINQGATHIVVMDSDGQHKPEQIPEFIEALKDHDIVFGVRSYGKEMPPVLKFGNHFFNKAAHFLYNIKISDTQTGFRAFTADAYKKVRWSATDYAMETEMIANAGKEQLNYKEIPIPTIYKDRYKGTTVLDGIKIFSQMLMWRLRWS